MEVIVVVGFVVFILIFVDFLYSFVFGVFKVLWIGIVFGVFDV